MLDFLINFLFPVVLIYFSIHYFYKFFKMKWPDLYFSISDFTGFVFVVEPLRFFLFRLVPVFLIEAIILGFFQNLDSLQKISVGIFTVAIYAIFTHGIAIIKILKKSKSIKIYLNKFFQIAIHFFTIFLLIAVAFLGGWFSSTEFVKKIIPSFAGLVDNIWASFIAISLFFLFQRILGKRNSSIDEILDRSLKNITPSIIRLIEEESNKNNCNKNLVLAICIVENIQRPSWVRILEKIKAIFSSKGTYGIMQVYSEGYINEEESVKIAASKYLKNTKELKNFKEVILNYNKDISYFKFVNQAYNFLEYKK